MPCPVQLGPAILGNVSAPHADFMRNDPIVLSCRALLSSWWCVLGGLAAAVVGYRLSTTRLGMRSGFALAIWGAINWLVVSFDLWVITFMTPPPTIPWLIGCSRACALALGLATVVVGFKTKLPPGSRRWSDYMRNVPPGIVLLDAAFGISLLGAPGVLFILAFWDSPRSADWLSFIAIGIYPVLCLVGIPTSILECHRGRRRRGLACALLPLLSAAAFLSSRIFFR